MRNGGVLLFGIRKEYPAKTTNVSGGNSHHFSIMELFLYNGNITMIKAEVLLDESLDQYMVILEKTAAIKDVIESSNPEEIQTLSVAIDEAQENAIKIEEKLEPFYTQISGLRRSPQFLCRTIIIKRILELTDTYTHKINSLIAINRDEMKNITGGRAVINKYHHTPEKKGEIINSSG